MLFTGNTRALCQALLPKNWSRWSCRPILFIRRSIPPAKLPRFQGPIITGILREELGYDGVITTDSITMGGSWPSIRSRAAIKAIEAGVDVILLKDDNSLRYEAHKALADAIRSGRLPEERVAQSLRRIWSLKWDYGLFARAAW